MMLWKWRSGRPQVGQVNIGEIIHRGLGGLGAIDCPTNGCRLKIPHQLDRALVRVAPRIDQIDYLRRLAGRDVESPVPRLNSTQSSSARPEPPAKMRGPVRPSVDYRLERCGTAARKLTNREAVAPKRSPTDVACSTYQLVGRRRDRNWAIAATCR